MSRFLKSLAFLGLPCRPSGGRFFIMRSLACACILLMSVVDVDGALSQDQKDTALQDHNRYRRDVSPRACPSLAAMTWNDELARVAQNYANTCNYNHNPQRLQQQTTFRSVGENLYISTGTAVNVARAVLLWNNEVNDYTLSTNKCLAGKACGHYTQIVWRSSTSVGCGAAVCDTANTPGVPSSWPSKYPRVNIVVCNYGPAGNYVGVAPYTTGSCTLPTTSSAQGMSSARGTSSAQESTAATIGAQPLNSTSSHADVISPPSRVQLHVLAAVCLALVGLIVS